MMDQGSQCRQYYTGGYFVKFGVVFVSVFGGRAIDVWYLTKYKAVFCTAKSCSMLLVGIAH